MKKPEIVAAILVKDKRTLDIKLKKVKGILKTAQIDVMDSMFVDNKTIPLHKIRALPSALRYELHFMVKDPLSYLEEASRLNAYMFTFHYESVRDKSKIPYIIGQIKAHKMKAGIAISPRTKAEKIRPYLALVDQVLVMTVRPGFGGQPLIFPMLDKVSRIRRWSPDIDIEVDGGVNRETVNICYQAGANRLVMGGGLLNNKDIRSAVKDMKRIAIR